MQGLIDCKKEYIEHIQDVLTIPISQRIYSIHKETIDNKLGLKYFQKELNNIPKWNNTIVEN